MLNQAIYSSCIPPQTRKEGRKVLLRIYNEVSLSPPHGFVFSRIVNLVAIVRNWQRVSITRYNYNKPSFNVVELESRRKVFPRVENFQARNFLRGYNINFFLLMGRLKNCVNDLKNCKSRENSFLKFYY